MFSFALPDSIVARPQFHSMANGRCFGQKVLYYKGLPLGVSTRPPVVRYSGRDTGGAMTRCKKKRHLKGGAKTFPPQEEVDRK